MGYLSWSGDRALRLLAKAYIVVRSRKMQVEALGGLKISLIAGSARDGAEITI